MSIEQEKKIDFIADNKDRNEVILFITDHLNWDEPDYDHAIMLQNKINSYLAFIESGQIFAERPSARGKKIIIEVRGKYPLNKKVEALYEKMGHAIKNAGFNLRFEYSKDE